MANRYSSIDTWTEDDLAQLPAAEDDYHEYKSSLTTVDALKAKLPVAASAFWNSGGGIFVVGVGGNGQIDGGISEFVGREPIRDWVDRRLSAVQPTGRYQVKAVTPRPTNSAIATDNVVLVVAFDESYIGPHMAPDKKYYLRAGAHTDPASHFLVEAIRARRGLSTPALRALTRLHPEKPDIVQLVVVAISDAPALDVRISLDPIPKILAEERAASLFPQQVAVIDRSTPFTMDLTIWGRRRDYFADGPVAVKLEYKDMLERSYVWDQEIDPAKDHGPLKIGSEMTERTVIALKELTSAIGSVSEQLLDFLERRLPVDEVEALELEESCGEAWAEQEDQTTE